MTEESRLLDIAVKKMGLRLRFMERIEALKKKITGRHISGSSLSRLLVHKLLLLACRSTGDKRIKTYGRRLRVKCIWQANKETASVSESQPSLAVQPVHAQ